ncbi:dTDP-4-dehydrorhamnose reductase [Isobaculum melis]|uniref:dTDP-4-dehydrorhamnose reductase n=1 Tax=Isobaculum melis TaxID=142588 RepID=A0A1H9QPS0_9LACT|nr:dTDP-4-dehydrorhamnose reductase [Isobaculum melis]SER62444.1 dTDP-4-dehydrorhamnose reductase [Isobaculum melis]
MSAKIMITGANGQLGKELSQLLNEKGLAFVGTDSKEMDITDAQMVNQKVMALQPTVIFHCAAYTAVDKAEDEGKEANYQVNVVGTENVAKAAEKVGATLIYISTDYVFDGTNQSEYLEDNQANPQNEYGRAKYEGELAVAKYCSQHYIVRTSWVFGEFGGNFVYTMLRLAETMPVISVVADQFGRPTWTRSLAEFIVYLWDQKSAYGIYHFSNDESCSWYEFAKEILQDKNVEVKAIESSDFPQKAKRPQYSVMNLEKAKKTGYKIINWQEALAQFKQGIIKKS